MNDHEDVPIGWRVFCILLIATPVTFLILSWLLGETGTTKTLLPFSVVAIGWFLLWGRKKRSTALHGIVGFLLVYQTYLLVSLPNVESIGIVWFTVVPALVALLGNRNHIFVWTPITLICVVYSWTVYSKFPFMSHPLSLPNLIGCTLFISVAAYAIVADRDRRESSLQSTIDLVQAEAVERRQAEKEANAARNAMSTFLASLSHEVRNPLTSIVLSADYLSMTTGEPDSIESVRTIRQSAESLMLVVDDVMELAKSDVGAIQVREEDFRLEDLFESIQRMTCPMLQKSDVRLFAGLSPDLPANWLGDERRIRQVVINLVSNALTYSSGTAIWVCVCRTPAGLRFEVGDNGCGISEQDQKRIFQPFQRLEQSHAEAPRGAGLGLSISRGYVRAMGGDLTVKSEIGAGSVFQFDIVCDVKDDLAIGQEHKLPLPSSFKFHVLDELPVITQWATDWLQSWGGVEDKDAQPFAVAEQLGNPSGFFISELKSAVAAFYGDGDKQVTDWTNESTALLEANGPHCKVLLCDDEAGVRTSLTRILKLHGFEVEACETGGELVELIKTRRPDMAFLDVQLANENGVEILREIRQTGETLPVCMLSGSMHHRAAALDAGADDYLLKPPDSSELLEAIQRVLNSTGSQAQRTDRTQ